MKSRDQQRKESEQVLIGCGMAMCILIIYAAIDALLKAVL